MATATQLQAPVQAPDASSEPPPLKRPSAFSWANLQWKVYPWISILIVLGLWQVVGAHLNPIFLSTPTAATQALGHQLVDGELLDSFEQTALTFLISLAASLAVGAPLGILMGRYRVAESSLEIVIRILYSVPAIALFPLFILAFGINNTMRGVVVFLSCVVPIAMNAQAGVKSVEGALLDVARVFGAKEHEIFTKMILPGTVPFLAGGFKIAVGRAIVTTVAVEMITSRGGLGGLMANYANQLLTAQYEAPLIATVLLSLGVYWLGDIVEKRFSRWRPMEAGTI
ncbi:MAG: ABC transporter permease [Chloroflexi bacterium]|nr:ABC transporter permease [Chloroflexota bacterium]